MKRLILLFCCLALMGHSCATTGAVPDNSIFSTVYCSLHPEDLPFSYDPDIVETKENLTDTRETVEGIVKANAVRGFICGEQ